MLEAQMKQADLRQSLQGHRSSRCNRLGATAGKL
jgi:hypothetical protein